MQRNDVQDMASDFEPAPLAIGPDGGIAITPEAKAIPPPPRLCEAGPCVNYHRFTTQLDAEAPIGSAVGAGGRVVGLPEGQPFHVETHHYCYPTMGIETKLGALPVLECNRWEPRIPYEVTSIGQRRAKFLASEAGQAFTDARAAWRAEVGSVRVELDEVHAWIIMNMRDGDYLDLKRQDRQLAWYQADGARNLSIEVIKAQRGPGTYVLEIKQNDSAGRPVITHTKTIEVI